MGFKNERTFKGLKIEELERGISFWEETNWPKDYHKEFYSQLTKELKKEPKDLHPSVSLTADCWNLLWRRLYSWSATRGPATKEELTQNAMNLNTVFCKEWEKSILPLLNKGIDIEAVRWEQISKFTGIVSNIKNVKSPVFTSKFCHFLAPRIFPVTDNAAMGNPFKTYEDYFKKAQNEWAATEPKTRKDLEARFRRNHRFGDVFPMKCKIIEICLIGRNQIRKSCRAKK